MNIYSFILTADGHYNELGPLAQADMEVGPAVWDAASQGKFFHWMAAWDAYTRTYTATRPRPLFRIDDGDDLYFFDYTDTGVGDISTGMMENARSLFAAETLWSRTCPTVRVKGNHEDSAFRQNSDGSAHIAATWRQAMNAWFALVDNPTDGSDVGDTGEIDDPPPVLDCMPDMTLASADKFKAYEGANDDGTHYCDEFARNADGSNFFPSKDAFTFAIGTITQHWVINPYRAACPSDPASGIGAGGAGQRNNIDWSLGRAQENWLWDSIRKSGARWKFIHCHQLPGWSFKTSGNKYYGRHSFMHKVNSTAEGRRFVRNCIRYGVTMVSTGHDHVFSVHRYGGVHWVNVPTPARTFGDQVGQMNQFHGFTYDLGATVTGFDAGYPRAHGHLCTIRTYGYLYVTVTTTEVKVYLRQTGHPLDSTTRLPLTTNYAYIGPEYTVNPTTGVLTIPDEISDGNVPVACPFAINKSEFDTLEATGNWGDDVGGFTSWYNVANNSDVGQTAWTADTVIVTDDQCLPTTPNGYVYRCTVAGRTHLTTEPVWPTTIGDTVVDNEVTWTCAKSYQTDHPLASATYPHGCDVFDPQTVGNQITISKGTETTVRAAMWPRTIYSFSIKHNPRLADEPHASF